MQLAYIALGSNTGDKRRNLDNALMRLWGRGLEITQVATYIITEPYGVTDQPEFLNTVCEIKTDLEPAELLSILLLTELQMGRVRTRKWGERNIDLDLILYGDEVINTEELTLPHPDMQNRDFVLRPLAEIAPDAMHPVLKKTAAQLWQEYQEKKAVK